MNRELEIMELRATLDRREAVIRMLEEDLRAAERKIKVLCEALQDAVDQYGKPGVGPWNVPGEPGMWLDKARKALKEIKNK